jgi:periplasmic divalent cation tolerance protein
MYLQVQVTVPSLKVAEELSHKLLANKLIACVQRLGPIMSSYHWQGKIQHEEEYLLLIKTVKSNFDLIETVIKESHPYDTPQIIALEIKKGNTSYLKWIDQELH